MRSIRSTSSFVAFVFVAGLMVGPPAYADDKIYEVTITNITQGQVFTPILVASHNKEVRLFELGEPASLELEDLAESGATGPLMGLLLSTDGVNEVVTAGGPLPPGASMTLEIEAGGKTNLISLAAMLVPTNDAFFSIQGVRVPKGKKDILTVFSPAYDAGTELNDEDCDDSIPGPPPCSGAGGDDELGVVHIHNGIHGIGELFEGDFDWRNPVARIQIQRQ